MMRSIGTKFRKNIVEGKKVMKRNDLNSKLTKKHDSIKI